ncbi:MAG: hydrogenase 4 subunit B, partial [Acetobacteraceae bacterium]
MPNDLFAAAAIVWFLGGALALTGRGLALVRAALGAGALAALAASIVVLPGGTAVVELPLRMAGESFQFHISPGAAWLMGFGLAPAALACWLATPIAVGRAGWLFGTSAALLGALGVFGLQNAGGFLISWEIMSLGGAVMILSERLAHAPGAPVLFMLGLLEVGAIALLIAFMGLVTASGSLS